MRVLVFDTETTGLPENQEAVVIEIAWALWDTTHKRILGTASRILQLDGEVPPEITEINGLTTGLCRENGASPAGILGRFAAAAGHCDALMARNGEMVGNIVAEAIQAKPLIDDYHDVTYPKKVKGGSLSHVAADLGILNAFPHSAIGDVLTMIRVVEEARIDWAASFESARQHLTRVEVKCAWDDKALQSKVKLAGFRYDGDRKIWWRHMRAHKINSLGFSVNQVFT